jgi:dTDP-glucose 4,6-dehydratase
MKVLVTGGSGFIGSNLVDYLIDKGCEVWNLSKHTYAMNPRVLEHLNSNPKYHFLPCDINDSAALLDLFQKIDFDVIFHLAAETHVDRSFIYPRDFFNSNLLGTFNLLEVLRRLERKPLLIYMSTDEVFGDVPEGFCKETDRINPRNPYSASKASAELYVRAYHYSFKLPSIIVRSMNNYGPRQHPEKLIAKIITRAIQGIPFTLYEGGSVRGWIYVQDTASALEYVARHGEIGEIYHIPAKDYLTVPEVCQRILSIMGKEYLFQGFKGRRLKDDERYALDGSKLKHLGWEPKISFEEGIRNTIEWYKQNEWFWKGVVAP